LFFCFRHALSFFRQGFRARTIPSSALMKKLSDGAPRGATIHAGEGVGALG
jgi:hypothetical protein